MAQNKPAEADTPTVAEQTGTVPADYRAAQVAEWGQYVAVDDIYVGVALAYRKGDPVPASNVILNGYGDDVVGKVN